MFDEHMRQSVQRIAQDRGRHYKSKFERLYALTMTHLSELRQHLRERERENRALSQRIRTGSPWVAIDEELPPPNEMLAFWNCRENLWERKGISEHAYQDKARLKAWLNDRGLSHWQYIYPPHSILATQQRKLETADQPSYDDKAVS